MYTLYPIRVRLWLRAFPAVASATCDGCLALQPSPSAALRSVSCAPNGCWVIWASTATSHYTDGKRPQQPSVCCSPDKSDDGICILGHNLNQEVIFFLLPNWKWMRTVGHLNILTKSTWSLANTREKQLWPRTDKCCPRRSLLAYLLLYPPGSVVSAGGPPLLSSGERWLSAGERCHRLCTVSIV